MRRVNHIVSRIREVGKLQVRIVKGGFVKVGVFKVRFFEVCLHKIHFVGSAGDDVALLEAHSVKRGHADVRIEKVHRKGLIAQSPVDPDRLALPNGHIIEGTVFDLQQGEIAVLKVTLYKFAVFKRALMKDAVFKGAVVKLFAFERLCFGVYIVKCLISVFGFFKLHFLPCGVVF